MFDFKIKLDGTEYLDPREWQEFELKLAWDGKFYLLTAEQEYTFIGSAYDYLVGQYDTDFCGKVSVEIWINEVRRFNGFIVLANLKINRIRRTAQTKISDGSFSALVKGKQDQEYTLDTSLGFDGRGITAIASRSIQFHTVVGGAYSGSNRTGYSVFETFGFLIRAMTGGEVGFESTLFDSGGDREGDTLFQGEQIRAATGDAPRLSFQQLFEDLDSLYNLGLWVEEDSDGEPVIRIERKEYFRSNDVSVTLSDVKEIKESIQVENLYSTIKLGSGDAREFDQDTPNTQFPTIPFLGHFEETFNTGSECVVENELDLSTNTLVVDSNSIENAFTGGNDDNDDKIFLVDVNVGSNNTVKTSIIGIGHVYNDAYSNENAVLSWEDGIPGPVAAYLGDGNDEFEAETGSTAAGGGALTIDPVQYDTEISDPNGNYDHVTNYDYNVPADGVYTFHTTSVLNIVWTNPPGGEAVLSVIIKINGTAEPAATYTITSDYSSTLDSQTFYLQSGDDITVRLEVVAGSGPSVPSSIQLASGSSYECVNTVNGGGQYAVFELANADLKRYSFDYPITLEQWDSIIADRKQAIQADTYKGNIEEITFRPFGVSAFVLSKVQ